ncbi:IPT/TIG domain-containing protein [Mucilaginibacter sp.]|uniref:IPT/TIG domain-containing protein n=1 Tax=Mucilaginibacter sp. TaxID=1882438 RepID=UPI0032641D54
MLVACKKGGSGDSSNTPLTIAGLSSLSGRFNASIIIRGTGFSKTASEDQVSFNGKPAIVSAASTTEITAVVPKGAGTGVVSIMVNGKSAAGPIFNYLYTATVSTFAGNGTFALVNGTGTAASFSSPSYITADKNGNVYVADGVDNVIRKITSAGVVTTLAGSGKAGSANGTGEAASFNSIYGIVADGDGNVFAIDHGSAQIRKVTPAGVVTTLAGSGFVGPAHDGTGSAATFDVPNGITIDASGNLYVLDGGIRKITPGGVVTTFPFAVDGFAYGLTIDKEGNFYTCNGQNYTIDKITASGVKTRLAGTGIRGVDDGQGTLASFGFTTSLAFDRAGNLLVVDNYNGLIRSINPSGVVTTLAGKLTGSFPTVDGSVDIATFYSLHGITVDPSGIVYVSEPNNGRIRKISLE